MPALRKSPALDLLLLLAHGAAWLALGAVSPAPWQAAMAALASVLVLCKGLSWPPPWRPVAALVPVLAVAVAQPNNATRIAALAAVAAAAGYLLFGTVRRAWLELAFRGPDGRAEGLDYGRWYRWSEGLRGRRRRRAWRVLFPRTDKEAALRGGAWGPRDRIDFADFTAEAIAAHDVALPLSAHDLEAIEPLRAQFAGHPVPLPTRDCIALCTDKPRFNRRLVECGFAAHVPAMDGPFAWPYILKKRVDEWGAHSHVVACADDERRLAAELADPAYFRQAFVPGRIEYTSHVLVRRGRIVRSLTLEFTFAHDRPVKSRDCVALASRVRRCAHRRLFAAMLRAVDFEGLGCFNYKLVDGRPLVFEFNPRFGASLAPYFPSFLRSLEAG